MARKRLILVGWDSADWKLINPLLDAGEMPGMAWLVEGGVSGNLATMEPQLTEHATPEPIETWGNPGGIQRERLPADDPSNRAMLEPFVALGYLAEIPGAAAGAAEATRQENDWSLARAFIDAGRTTTVRSSLPSKPLAAMIPEISGFHLALPKEG